MFPTLEDHLRLELKFKQREWPWVVPPKEKHAYVRAWLSNCYKGGLDSDDRLWLSRRRLRNVKQDNRKLVDEGADLFDLLIRAHSKDHISAEKTWARVHKLYVGPSREFVDRWVRVLCPTCK